MKKLLLSLLVLLIVKGLISAAPCNYKRHAKLTSFQEYKNTANPQLVQQKESGADIHPMDILTLKFN